jgi:hypothetical protein
MYIYPIKERLEASDEFKIFKAKMEN